MERIDEKRLSAADQRLSFGVFELDLRTAELRRDGNRVKLQEQPFRLLECLLERAGDVVTREELRARLWPADYVDFDHGINVAVRKLREALDDSAETPRFIETLARRGYRFIAPVTRATAPQRRRGTRSWRVIAAGMLLVAAAAAAWWSVRPQKKTWAGKTYAVAVLPFTNDDRGVEYLSDGLTEILIDTLSRFSGIRVMARDVVFRYKEKEIDVRDAGRALHVSAVIAGHVRRENGRYVVHVELIDVRDGAQMWGDQFTATATTLPTVQAQIADALSDHLWQRDKKWQRPRDLPVDARAFELYLRGRDALHRGHLREGAAAIVHAFMREPKFAARKSAAAAGRVLSAANRAFSGEPRT